VDTETSDSQITLRNIEPTQTAFDVKIMWAKSFLGSISPTVNSADAVCDQKPFKFFVSHWEESMAGHMGVKGIY
jgi:hypothetical protein